MYETDYIEHTLTDSFIIIIFHTENGTKMSKRISSFTSNQFILFDAHLRHGLNV